MIDKNGSSACNPTIYSIDELMRQLDIKGLELIEKAKAMGLDIEDLKEVCGGYED